MVMMRCPAAMARDKALWTDGDIAPAKVLSTRWMRQFAHTWTHFATWVPWVRRLRRGGQPHALGLLARPLAARLG